MGLTVIRWCWSSNAAVLRPYVPPCDEIQKSPRPATSLFHDLHTSESESADLASVYMISAVIPSHDTRQGIRPHRDDVDNGRCA